MVLLRNATSDGRKGKYHYRPEHHFFGIRLFVLQPSKKQGNGELYHKSQPLCWRECIEDGAAAIDVKLSLLRLIVVLLLAWSLEIGGLGGICATSTQA